MVTVFVISVTSDFRLSYIGYHTYQQHLHSVKTTLLKVSVYSPMFFFFAIFTKGNNLCDFQFASLDHEALQNGTCS